MAKFRSSGLVGGLVFLAFVSLLMGLEISNSILVAVAFLALVLAGFFLILQAWRKNYPADYRSISITKSSAIQTRKEVPLKKLALNLNEQPQPNLIPSAEPPCRAVREAEEIARAAYNRLYGKSNS